jgi:hypothetical protein
MACSHDNVQLCLVEIYNNGWEKEHIRRTP